MRTFTSFDDLTAAVGEDLGASDWLTIEQDRVDAFAEATGDHQWIHVDVPRATAGPFGGTISHGYLTLSLIPMLGAQVFGLETPGAKLNYGVNKVRFPSPLPVGSRILRTLSQPCLSASRAASCATMEAQSMVYWCTFIIASIRGAGPQA